MMKKTKPIARKPKSAKPKPVKRTAIKPKAIAPKVAKKALPEPEKVQVAPPQAAPETKAQPIPVPPTVWKFLNKGKQMKIEHKPLTFVDTNYNVFQAVSVSARDSSEFNEPNEEPRVTLLYFPKETENELLRGNVTAAIKVVYDVTHASHPAHAPFEEKNAVQEKSHVPVSGMPVLNLVTKHESTGFMVKPGGFYLNEGEAVPEQKVDVPVAKAPAVHEAPVAHSDLSQIAVVKTLMPAGGTYRGVLLHTPSAPDQDKLFYKEKAIVAYMAEKGIKERKDLTSEDHAAIMQMPDDFEADVAAADKFLRDNNLPGKLDESIFAFRNKVSGAQTPAAEGSQTVQ